MPKKTVKRKKPNKGGRPPVITKEVTAKLLGFFSRGMSIVSACRLAKISDDTYQRKYKKDKGFASDVDQAREMFIALAHDTIYNSMNKKDGDARIAIEVLKRLRNDEWGDKVATKIDVHDPGIAFVVTKVPIPGVNNNEQ